MIQTVEEILKGSEFGGSVSIEDFASLKVPSSVDMMVYKKNLRRTSNALLMHPNLWERLLKLIKEEELCTFVFDPPPQRIKNAKYKGKLFNTHHVFTSEDITVFDDLDEDMVIVDFLSDGAIATDITEENDPIPSIYIDLDPEARGKMLSPVRIHILEKEND